MVVVATVSTGVSARTAKPNGEGIFGARKALEREIAVSSPKGKIAGRM